MNIAKRLPELAKGSPDQVAVTCPKNLRPERGVFDYQSLTFKELDQLSLTYAHGLLESGLKKGDKVLMFVRPSLRFSALAFALFRAGLVPIFIDPGMGRKNLLKAVAQIKPDGLLAEPEVHFLRLIFQKPFRSVRSFVTTGHLSWGKMRSIHDFKKNHQELMEEVLPSDTAAILFTSGGTGIPKGVRYTHKIFNAQVDRLKEMFSLGPDEVDLPGFPLFSLFTITMGMRSAIPAMNPSKPASCNPEWLVKNILDQGATFVAGSPSIWNRVADYCLAHSLTLPSVKYLVMFGAPVSLDLHTRLKKILPNGDTYTPYGATECLPVSCLSGTEVLNKYATLMKEGKGTCVGKAVPETQIKIAPITEEELTFGDFTWQGEGNLGEVCVLSDTVTPEYVGMPEKTRLAKFTDDQGRLWHRMGDLGYLDGDGALWFCGRKSHGFTFKGEILPSVPNEAHFLEIPDINRVAFVGPKFSEEVKPSLVIEPRGKINSQKKSQIKELVLSKAKGANIPLEGVYFCSSFPVDVRHNIKIDRLKLTQDIEQGALK